MKKIIVNFIIFAFLFIFACKANDLKGKTFSGDYGKYNIKYQFITETQGQSQLTGGYGGIESFTYKIEDDKIIYTVPFRGSRILGEYKDNKIIGNGFSFNIDNDLSKEIILEEK